MAKKGKQQRAPRPSASRGDGAPNPDIRGLVSTYNRGTRGVQGVRQFGSSVNPRTNYNSAAPVVGLSWRDIAQAPDGSYYEYGQRADGRYFRNTIQANQSPVTNQQTRGAYGGSSKRPVSRYKQGRPRDGEIGAKKNSNGPTWKIRVANVHQTGLRRDRASFYQLVDNEGRVVGTGSNRRMLTAVGVRSGAKVSGGTTG